MLWMACVYAVFYNVIRILNTTIQIISISFNRIFKLSFLNEKMLYNQF